MKKIILLLILSIYTVSFGQKKATLKEGDIIFQSMNCDLCKAINAVTEGFDGHDFSHLGMIHIKNDSIYVIEAAGKNVKLTPLEVFKTYTTDTMYVGRLKRKYRKYIPKAIEFSMSQMGVPYDEAYLYDNGSYYCSELIYDAFLAAYEKPFFELTPMTFKEPNSNQYFQVWIVYYENLKIEIPEGELGCNPGGISTSNKLKIIGVI
ncbi:YiiX/YebB-like N1pC/P60 family cysteine hydrolase [uncultured Flavobacterium sp.]|uniref:YiiX/YebB-like N1pC/P60 family cysteine hydrolase n=1 Tax=uncultured Flavobacterium sp. TaxID=165435 RepID=UPI0030EB2E3B|tara:strand:- start:148303 stop:148920 length:618 start_codon:yes stop_codon:yes gene_type:complete